MKQSIESLIHHFKLFTEGLNVQSTLEEIGDTFGLIITTLSSVLLLIFSNAPEGRFENLVYFISLAFIFQCIHYVYDKFFKFLFRVLNYIMESSISIKVSKIKGYNVDEKKLSNKK